METFRTLLAVAALSMCDSSSAWAQSGTCGSCPSVGFCPPTLPLGAGPFEDHRCENLAVLQIPDSNFSFAQLSKANLSNTNLVGSDLSNAMLIGVDFRKAFLHQANLTDANLSRANLIDAVLFETNLSGANLYSANFSKTILAGANVSNANFSNANFAFATDLHSMTGMAYYDSTTNFTGTVFDPVRFGWIDTTPFRASTSSISLSAGGQQEFSLYLGLPDLKANWAYWIFGSATGTSPGLDFGGDVVLPLNYDAYFQFTLTKPLAGIYSGFLGVLDGAGEGTATLTLPPGLDPLLAGQTLYHAYVATAMFPGFEYVSDAVSVLLVP